MGSRLGLAVLTAAGLVAAAPDLALAASQAMTEPSAPAAAAQAALPEGIATRPTDEGLALADAHGQVLYRLDLDRYKVRRRQAAPMIDARCAGVCDKLWRPVLAPATFAAGGDWGVAEHKGAPAQLTYKGDPLYTFVGQSLEEAKAIPVAPPYFSSYAAKTSLMRDGVPVGTVYWHEALYQPAAPDIVTPAGVRLSWVKAAYVFADGHGHELYAAKAGASCAADCGGLAPLPAPLAAHAVGGWRPVAAKDGLRVWSYRGRIVYQAQDVDAEPGADWDVLAAR